MSTAKALVRLPCGVDEVARNLFGSSGYPPIRENYELIAHASEEILSGCMYRFRVRHRTGSQASLQIYSGLGRIGGQLWEQETRALLRVSNLEHPALPRILDAAFCEDRDFAYVATESSGRNLLPPHETQRLCQEPEECLRQLGLLADALDVLNSQGIMHRNLWPGTIEVSGNGRRLRLWLARFEMSAFLSNLMRRVDLDRPLGENEARRFILSQGPQALACLPPEKLACMDPTQSASESNVLGLMEADRGDVFALGVIAWQWFVKPLPSDMLKAAFPEGRIDFQAARSLRDHLRAEIAPSRLGAGLQSLLHSMLAEDWRERATAAQVAEEVARRADALTISWTPPEAQSQLVAFMPEPSRETVWRWGWIENDPSTPQGLEELKEFLRADLARATLVYSPDGFQHTPDVSEAKRQARYVLLGRKGAWYSVPHRDYSPEGKLGDVLPEILLIKYVVSREEAWQLDQQPFQKRVYDIEAIPFDLNKARIDELRQGRPSWGPLLEAVERQSTKPRWRREFEQAIDWLLEYQLIELMSREYAYVRDPESQHGSVARLLYDRDRDSSRYSIPLFSLFAKVSRRPAFGDFFDSLESTDHRTMLSFRAEGVDRGKHSGTAMLVERLDQGAIQVRRLAGSTALPEKGWIRPKEDEAADVGFKRQREARFELFDSKGLVEQLNRPTAVSGPRNRWVDAGRGLRGQAPEIVQDMLACQTLYALHGPPGTGKTTVAVQALSAFLEADKSARILITAQSNYALDNLAYRLVSRIEEQGVDVLSIRLATSSDSADKVDERLRPYLPSNLAQTIVNRIQESCRRRLRQRRDTPQVRKVLEDWLEQAPQSQLEIHDRLRRGANLVAATCSGATKRNLEASGSFDGFDWVLVEEAAKAWPTELAIPLVRGPRWTLIGDHRQLPAFRRHEVEELLAACADSADPELQAHGARRRSYTRVFDLFGSLFEARSEVEERQGAQIAASSPAPLGRLTRQFRMRKPIAEMISRAFYENSLETDDCTEADSGVLQPEFLAGKALVWIDTSAMLGFGDKPRWSNPGEAGVVARLLERLEPFPVSRRVDQTPLAVLSPYWDQIDELQKRVPQRCRSLLHTVHSFQGREADIMVVSLVRHKTRGALAYSNLGHLVQKDLVNVMLSRGRRLLVIVGNYNHFSRQTETLFWPVVCKAIEELGQILPAAQALGLEGDGSDS